MTEIQKHHIGQRFKEPVTGALHLLETTGKITRVPGVRDVLIPESGIFVQIMQFSVRIAVEQPAEVPAVLFIHADDKVIGVIITAPHTPCPVTGAVQTAGFQKNTHRRVDGVADLF